MQCTAFPAVIPIHVRNDLLHRGPGFYNWRGREFEVVVTPERRLRVFEIDCYDPRPRPMPMPAPQPAPAPAPHPNVWRLASFAAIGLGAISALFGATNSYWHPLAHAMPGLLIAGAGVAGVVATNKDSKLHL